MRDAPYAPGRWWDPYNNFNYQKTDENGVVNADVREGTDRFEDHASFQELFVEYHLGDLTPTYDFLSTRPGIQPFGCATGMKP